VNAATRRGENTYNTSLLWPATDGEVQLFDKANPVPFGEYVPDRWLYQRIAPDLIGLIGREYTPGTNSPHINLNGVGVGLAICFDVIFDDVIWQGAQDGAQLYLLQSNNGDFRGTDENLQQAAFARMRAIETGRSVVNVSTTGTSQAFAPDGTLLDDLPADTAGARVTTIPLRTGLTPAVTLGTWTAGLLAATSLPPAARVRSSALKAATRVPCPRPGRFRLPRGLAKGSPHSWDEPADPSGVVAVGVAVGGAQVGLLDRPDLHLDGDEQHDRRRQRGDRRGQQEQPDA